MDPKLRDKNLQTLGTGVSTRLDDAQTGTGIFFERELEHIQEEVLREKMPPLSAFNLIPADRSVPAHARTYACRMFKSHGVAKFISNYSRDLPMVGVDAEEKTFNARTIAVAYGYSVEEIEAAVATGKPLDPELARAARRSTEELQNETAWFGNDDVGLYGITNFPQFPRLLIDTPFDERSTADEILAAMHLIANGVHLRTKGTARSTVMVMPLTQLEYISNTARSSTSDTTILEYFLRTNRFVNQVTEASELDESGPDGEPMVFCFDPPSGAVKHVLPLMFTQYPAQFQDFDVKIPCKAKSGGIMSMYPLEVTLAVLPKAA